LVPKGQATAQSWAALHEVPQYLLFRFLFAGAEEITLDTGALEGAVDGLMLGLVDGLMVGLVDGLMVGLVDGLVAVTLERIVEGMRVTGAFVGEATGDGMQKVRPVKQASPVAQSELEPLGHAR